jgi:hypothetical protein
VQDRKTNRWLANRAVFSTKPVNKIARITFSVATATKFDVKIAAGSTKKPNGVPAAFDTKYAVGFTAPATAVFRIFVWDDLGTCNDTTPVRTRL